MPGLCGSCDWAGRPHGFFHLASAISLAASRLGTFVDSGVFHQPLTMASKQQRRFPEGHTSFLREICIQEDTRCDQSNVV